MRLCGLMMLGALMVGASGCGDSVGPPHGEGNAADLEFFMPEARLGSPPQATPSPLQLVEAQRSLEESGDDSPKPALLLDHYVTGSWMVDQLTLSYGLFGLGTGYSVGARAELFAQNGAPTGSFAGRTLQSDQPTYWYVRPHGEETFATPRRCGQRADAYGDFEVRSRYQVEGVMQDFHRRQFGQSKSEQQSCPPGTTEQGTISTSGVGSNITICYYTVWVDSEGNVVSVQFIGCTTVSGDGNVT